MKKQNYLPQEIGIIAFVPNKWNGVWTVRHQVLSRLASNFKVIWVSPTPGWRALWSNSFKEENALELIQNQLKIFPHSKWLPKIYRYKLIDSVLDSIRIFQIKKMLKKMGVKKHVAYIWRPEFHPELEKLKPDFSIYHIDDEYSFSTTEVAVSDKEKKALEKVDQVFIHSKTLYKKKKSFNPNTIIVPNGVDCKAYNGDYEEPVDLSSIPKPRITCVSVIKKQLDLELVVNLAQKKREWSFVFIGPIGNVSGKEKFLKILQNLQNTYFLGCKDVSELPAYVQYTDVCTLPYEINAYTNYIFPLKMLEYMAAGKPMVGSPISTVLDFKEYVRVAESLTDWEIEIGNCLKEENNSRQLIVERKKAAAEFDWNFIVQKINDIIISRFNTPEQNRK